MRHLVRRIAGPTACRTLIAATLVALQACGGGGSNSGSGSTPPPTTNPPQASGLDAPRPTNASCLAWDRPDADASIALTQYTSLTFTSPVAMLQAPHDDTRWFVVEQDGVVRQFNVANPASSSVFINITDRVDGSGEMGLLGMAFHPDFPADPRVFLSYTNEDAGRVSRISAFTATGGGATLDPASEVPLLTIDQPESNHNGGNIAFGPDGFLYIGMGDGGGGGDNHGNPGNGQRLTTMLGKMLRIDVDAAAPYGIPPTNPFAANARCPAGGRASGECPEIYAWGFRNPWRWSFDRSNGALWVADVGQDVWEEVNEVTLGGNYGWRCREGAHDFNSGGTTGCSSGGLIDPVTEYDHTMGNSITGGYVYRGSAPTALAGRYLFADFVSGRIWAWIPENATTPREPTLLAQSGLNISSFGEANNGDLYVVNHAGTLHRITFQSFNSGTPIPATLSATGCVNPANPSQPASGLIPYSVNAPFWSDGADKERWIALPNNGVISVQSGGDWGFPERTVLMKHFRIGTRLVETRLLMRHPDGNWGGFTYEWNAGQTDATLLSGGAQRDVGGGQTWIFPSESDCLECHTAAAGRALGLETAQLNRNFTYTQTGRTANQLATLNHLSMLTPAITDPAAQPSMPDPTDTTAQLTNRARAYLHTNCSQCHRPGGTGRGNMDLRYTTAFASTNTCNAAPTAGDLGVGANARLIAPGSAANSIVVNRMDRRDQHAMPPLGSNRVDTAGVQLLTQWINSLTSC